MSIYTQTIIEDIAQYFGSKSELLTYISESKVDEIINFNGIVIFSNSWDLIINLSDFNIPLNSIIKIYNNDKQYIYSRYNDTGIYGDNDLDLNFIYTLDHASFFIILVENTKILVWVATTLSNTVKQNTVKLLNDRYNETLKSIEKTKDEIFINTIYLSQDPIYFKYLNSSYTTAVNFNQILNSNYTEQLITSLYTFYPQSGWYIFYQKVGNNIVPLTFDYTVGAGLRRVKTNIDGCIFIENTNYSLLYDIKSQQGSLPSYTDFNINKTDPFIRIETYLVYLKESVCLNRNISRALPSVNLIDLEDGFCDDILSTDIFQEPDFVYTNFGDTDIFLGVPNFLSTCENIFLINSVIQGLSYNKNSSYCNLNFTTDRAGISFNNNITYSRSSSIVQFESTSVNTNISTINTSINIGNSFNQNVSTGDGRKGIRSSFGNAININYSQAISTIPTESSTSTIINRNTSRAILDTTKGLIATCINTQVTLARLNRIVYTGSTTSNTNTSVCISPYLQIPSSQGTSTHFNTSTAVGLSGQESSALTYNFNTTSIPYLDVNYNGSATCVNINTCTSKNTVYISSGIGTAQQLNTTLIID